MSGLEGAAFAIFIIWVLLGACQNIALAEMQGALRYDLVGWSGMMAALVMALGAVLFVSERDLVSAMLVMAASLVFQALPVLRLLGEPVRARPGVPQDQPALPATREIVVYGFNAWLVTLTTILVWSRGELIVIEAVLDQRSLGLYGAAITLTALVWRLTGMLQGAVEPHLSRRLSNGGEAEDFIAGMNRLCLTASACCALTVALLGRELSVLVYGSRYAEAGEIMAWLAPGVAVAGIGTVNLAVQYLSQAVFNRNALIVGSVMLLALAWAATQAGGIMGAAGARSVVLLGLGAVMAVWLLRRVYAGLGAEVLKDLAIVASMVGLASMIALVVQPGLAARLGLLCAGCYLLAFRATGRWNPAGMVSSALGQLRSW